jgi:hypothetical protein
MKDRNRETEDPACENEEEDSDLGDDSDNDCYKVAYTLDYPQFEQLLEKLGCNMQR